MSQKSESSCFVLPFVINLSSISVWLQWTFSTILEGVDPSHVEPPNLPSLPLQPHLHKIVNSSMELAQTAKEPYNYFLLLRALFRSIGGGSHDLLYQEFLPLLPNLLQGQSNDFVCFLVLFVCLSLAALGCWGSSSAPSEGHGEWGYMCKSP